MEQRCSGASFRSQICLLSWIKTPAVSPISNSSGTTKIFSDYSKGFIQCNSESAILPLDICTRPLFDTGKAKLS